MPGVGLLSNAGKSYLPGVVGTGFKAQRRCHVTAQRVRTETDWLQPDSQGSFHVLDNELELVSPTGTCQGPRITGTRPACRMQARAPHGVDLVKGAFPA